VDIFFDFFSTENNIEKKAAASSATPMTRFWAFIRHGLCLTRAGSARGARRLPVQFNSLKPFGFNTDTFSSEYVSL
jgi:hypothetical protein